MPAYILVRVDINDAERYGEYLLHSPRAIGQFGGRFIVRGPEPTTLEGPDETSRIVIVEFPDTESAQAFYESEEYQKAKALREGAGDAQFLLLDGYPAEEWDAVLDASNQRSL